MPTPHDNHPRSSFFSGLTAREARRLVAKTFEAAGLPFAEDDALEIVLSATGLDKTSMMLRGTEPLASKVVGIIKEHMERRLSGEPVDHILGWREFYGRRFIISRDVLSPRADTENLIRGALQRLESIANPKILDLGTGSGAIGLTLLAELSGAQLLATDVSRTALEIAKKNAAALNLKNRVTFDQGSWWAAVPDAARFDMILSNPPYITGAAMERLEPEVKQYDPELALCGGTDGLDAYRKILEQADRYLQPFGWLGFEIGFDQGDALRRLCRSEPWTDIMVETDLGGLDRVVWTRKCD